MHTFSIWISGLIAVIASVVVNALLVTVLLPFTGVPDSVMTFKVAGPTGLFTVIGVIGAVIVFAIVRRFSGNPNGVFTWIAAIVLAVSLLPDIFIQNLGPMFAEITMSGAVLLMALHIACATITVLVLTKLTKPVVASRALSAQ